MVDLPDLRFARQFNYAAKRRADFTCEAEGCSKSNGLLVCTVNHKGNVMVLCGEHKGNHPHLPGQWIDRRKNGDG